MDEVLVHISAPSTSSDDTRYSAQAAAIREYLRTADQQRRQRPTPDYQGAEEPTTGDPQPGSDDDAANPAITSENPTHEHIELDRPEPESIGPALLADGDRTRQADSDRGDDSLESLVSVIPDSQPEQLLHEGQGSSPISLYYEYHSPPTAEASNKRRGLEAEVQEQTNRGTSVLADEAAATKETSNKPPKPSSTPTHQEHPLTNTLLKNLPLQIHPPPPPISSTPFTTHITPTLAMLTDRLNPARTYKPTAQQRQLGTLERGYWAVRIRILHSERLSESKNQNDKRTWTASFFTRFWTFLSEFIGKDARAGWGVWCFLDHDDHHNHAEDSSPLAGPSVPTTLAPPASTFDPVPVLLKVYTWGETAMHIYLVLFLASERRIRGLGLQWVDSRGEVVIQMS